LVAKEERRFGPTKGLVGGTEANQEVGKREGGGLELGRDRGEKGGWRERRFQDRQQVVEPTRGRETGIEEEIKKPKIIGEKKKCPQITSELGGPNGPWREEKSQTTTGPTLQNPSDQKQSEKTRLWRGGIREPGTTPFLADGHRRRPGSKKWREAGGEKEEERARKKKRTTQNSFPAGVHGCKKNCRDVQPLDLTIPGGWRWPKDRTPREKAMGEGSS